MEKSVTARCSEVSERTSMQIHLDTFQTMQEITGLAIPVIAGMVSHSILNFADRYFIAKLGVEQAAGASICVTIMWFLFTLSTLVTGGTIALVSRKIGEGKPEEVIQSAQQSILLSFVLSLMIAVICFFVAQPIFTFFGIERGVEVHGIIYFRILVAGLPCVFLIQTISAVFQAAGDTRTPMRVFTGMSVFNLVIDPIFIFDNFEFCGIHINGFGFGIQGAGYATLIAEFLATVWIGFELSRFNKFSIWGSAIFRPDFQMIKRILQIGRWRGLNSFSRPLTGVLLQKIIALHGTNAIAAFIFGFQWISLVFLIFEGLIVAIATLVGRNLGRKDIRHVNQVIQSGLYLGGIVVTVFIVLGLTFAEHAIGLFTDNPAIIAMGTNYMYIVLISMVFSVPMIVYTAAFNGAGDTLPPMIVAFFANWIGKIVIGYYASISLGFGVNGVWIAIAMSIVMESAGDYIWFRRGEWKTKTV